MSEQSESNSVDVMLAQCERYCHRCGCVKPMRLRSVIQRKRFSASFWVPD